MSSSGTKCLFLPAVALVVATTLAITGCADGVAPGAGPKPIKLGSLMAVTGLGLPDRLAAVKAAVRHVNAHGGIRGRPLQLENCDDQNDPNLAQGCARQLV